jgi:hypothetical protein
MIEKYYVRQNFAAIDLITVEQHSQYESLYKVKSSMTGVLNVPKSICFNTFKEALDYTVRKLNADKDDLETRILRIKVKLNKLQKLEEKYQEELKTINF